MVNGLLRTRVSLTCNPCPPLIVITITGVGTDFSKTFNTINIKACSVHLVNNVEESSIIIVLLFPLLSLRAITLVCDDIAVGRIINIMQAKTVGNVYKLTVADRFPTLIGHVFTVEHSNVSLTITTNNIKAISRRHVDKHSSLT